MTNHEYKKAFFARHNHDWTVSTSALDEYDRYVKVYTCADGAQLTEVNGPEWMDVTITLSITGQQIKTDRIKVFVTECWSTDDAHSVKWYEAY